MPGFFFGSSASARPAAQHITANNIALRISLLLASVPGQRDEFGLARHRRELSLRPVPLCLLDARLRAGDEIPPDQAPSLERRAAEQRQPAVAARTHAHRFAGLENRDRPRTEPLAFDLHFSLRDMCGALRVLRGEIDA